MTSRNSALRQGQRIALLVAMACWAAARAEAQAPAGFGVGSYGVVPGSLAQAGPNVITWDGTSTSGVTLNTLLGADRFYNAGIYGQYASAANVEAGNIWNQHETLTKVTYEYTAPGAAGDFDWHATAVGMIIAGLGPPAPGGGYYWYQLGIAPRADLYSGAMATAWSSGGSFYFSDQAFYDAYNNFFTTSFIRSYGGTAIIAPNDVINCSWGGSDTTGTETYTLALDGFAWANPQTSFVAAAGNSGTSNGVLGPASGYNGISVGATGDFSLGNFNVVASFSSRGPQDYYDPVHGLVRGVRAAVDLVAPGTSIATAYYGGTTGSNQFAGSDPSGGATDWYTIGAAGTSFAAPMVSGGVALLKSASYIDRLGSDSRDTRVVKAVLMNSATKLPGWNNGQATNAAGVIVTTQSLDWAQGAGQLNLNTAYDQYLSGTRDVPGTSGGTIASIGWDYGTLTIGGHNDYTIQGTLHGRTLLDVTLDWFRNCAAPTLDVNQNLVVSNAGFANLDLEVWNSTFTRLYAVSNSLYNNVQHLHYILPGDGQYAIRVDYTGQMFGTPVAEPYGLAWNNLTSTVSATYTRAATSGSGTIIVGGVTDVAASIHNTAADPTADSLTVSNLRPVASGGTVTAGTAYSGSLAPGGTGSTAGFTFTAAVPGTYTLTPAVDQADNALLGGPAAEDLGSPITAAVTVLAHASAGFSSASAAFGRVMRGMPLPTPSTELANAANPAPNARAGLQITDLGGLADSGAGIIAPGNGRTLSALAVPTGATGAYSRSYTVGLSDDQSIPGWNALPGLTFSVSATVLDNRVVTATPVNFGPVHVGQNITRTSTLTTTGDNDHFTAVTVLAAVFDSPASTATYTMSKTFNTSGPQSGQDTLPTTGEGLANETPLDVSVAYSATAYQYAQPQWVKTGGSGVLSGSGTSYTLDFGSVHGGASLPPASLAVLNGLLDAVYQDSLDGAFDAGGMGSPFSLAGSGSFSGVPPGGSQTGVQLALNTNFARGTFHQSLTLQPVSDGTAVGLGTTPLPPITLNLVGNVFAYQSSWIAPAGGSWPDPAKWRGSVPQLKFDSALVANLAAGAAATITLDGVRTLGDLTLGSTARPGAYTIAPGAGGALVLDNDVAPATVTVAAGSQTISAPLHLASNAAIGLARAGSLTLSGPVDGPGAILQSGGGTLVFRGSNSYTGGTAVSGGTLTLLGAAKLGSASGALAVNNPNTGPGTAVVVNLNSAQTVGGLSGAIATPASGANTAAINLAGRSVVLTVNQQTAGVYAGTLTGAGGLVKAGSALLALAGADAYSGGTTLAAGTLDLRSRSALGSGGLVINGGALGNGSAGPVSLSSKQPQTWNVDFGFVGPQDLDLGTAAVILSGPGVGRQITVQTGTLTIGGPVAGRCGLVKAGSGTLALGALNTYSGGTTLLAGTLAIKGVLPLGTGPLTIGGGALNNIGTAPITLGWGSLTWSGDFSVLGASGLSFGTAAVRLAGAGSSRQVTVQTGTLAVGGPIAGPYGLVKAGSGTLSLGGGNSYSGGTTVNGGTLAVLHGASLGAARGPLAVNNLNTGPGTAVVVNLNSAQTVGGLSGAIATPASGANTAAINLSTTTAVLTVNQQTNALYAGTLAGAGGLVKAGSGLLALASSNTYVGGTTLAAGTLGIDSASALGTGRFVIQDGALDNAGPGPVTLATNNPQAWNADFSFVGTQDLDLGGGAVTLGPLNGAGLGGHQGLSGGAATPAGTDSRRVTVDGGTLTVGGSISGAYGLVKAGPGTLALDGSNTYTGGTTIGAGRLVVARSLGSALNLQAAGCFSPGIDAASVTTGPTTWSGGGRYQLDLSDAAGAPGAGWDLWNIAGSLSFADTVGGLYTIELDSLAGSAPGQAARFHNDQSYHWEIASTTGGISGFDAAEFAVDTSGFANALAGGQFEVARSGNLLYLDFVPDPLLSGLAFRPAAKPLLPAPSMGPVGYISATPEPSSFCLLAAAAACGLAARRRLRRG